MSCCYSDHGGAVASISAHCVGFVDDCAGDDGTMRRQTVSLDYRSA